MQKACSNNAWNLTRATIRLPAEGSAGELSVTGFHLPSDWIPLRSFPPVCCTHSEFPSISPGSGPNSRLEPPQLLLTFSTLQGFQLPGGCSEPEPTETQQHGLFWEGVSLLDRPLLCVRLSLETVPLSGTARNPKLLEIKPAMNGFSSQCCRERFM